MRPLGPITPLHGPLGSHCRHFGPAQTPSRAIRVPWKGFRAHSDRSRGSLGPPFGAPVVIWLLGPLKPQCRLWAHSDPFTAPLQALWAHTDPFTGPSGPLGGLSGPLRPLHGSPQTAHWPFGPPMDGPPHRKLDPLPPYAQ